MAFASLHYCPWRRCPHWTILAVTTLAILILLAGCREAPADSANLPKLVGNIKIVVSKSERKMYVYADERLLRTYPVGLGFNPEADKIKEGDGATPEGEFYVFTKNPESKYYLSLGLSYPNAEDAKRGLDGGLIDETQYQNIVQANRDGRKPPQNTPLGGEIYIHGRGSGSDWTWGCVALDDANMKELFEAVTPGTKVTIKH
jgi:murein L,D-transpeptidase YafK